MKGLEMLVGRNNVLKFGFFTEIFWLFICLFEDVIFFPEIKD